MILKVIGVARLTRDVEIRYTQSGSAIANFSVASSKKYKTKSGEQREDVTFVDCTAFGKLGEICNNFLKKSSQIYVVGELKLEQWAAQDGTKRSKHVVIVESMQMLDSKNNSQQNGGYNAPAQHEQPSAHTAPQQRAAPSVPENDIDGENIPF